MSDEKSDFARAVAKVIEDQQGPPGLSRLHRVVIVDQTPDLSTIGVKSRDADAPSATAKPVPIYFGLPGFTAKFLPSATPETMLGFNGGREDGSFSSLYPVFPQGISESPAPLPIEYLAFGGGSKPIARKDDTTANGALLFKQTPVGPGGVPSTLTISYRDAVTSVITPVLTMPIPGPVIPNPALIDPLDPTTVVLELGGHITSGREEFRA